MSLVESRLLSKAILRPSERHRGRPSVFTTLVRLVGFTSVPVGSKVKISKFPVLIVAQAILPFPPGKAAPAGDMVPATPDATRARAPSTSPAFFFGLTRLSPHVVIAVAQ